MIHTYLAIEPLTLSPESTIKWMEILTYTRCSQSTKPPGSHSSMYRRRY